mmetsp:Transcript_46569/g.122991  ORF Transcript_46569/g.122991 Transcript_46569/m.122991 type:complete len:230 (+) Transcript_46569:433-1122(+)
MPLDSTCRRSRGLAGFCGADAAASASATSGCASSLSPPTWLTLAATSTKDSLSSSSSSDSSSSLSSSSSRALLVRVMRRWLDPRLIGGAAAVGLSRTASSFAWLSSVFTRDVAMNARATPSFACSWRSSSLMTLLPSRTSFAWCLKALLPLLSVSISLVTLLFSATTARFAVSWLLSFCSKIIFWRAIFAWFWAWASSMRFSSESVWELMTLSVSEAVSSIVATAGSVG